MWKQLQSWESRSSLKVQPNFIIIECEVVGIQDKHDVSVVWFVFVRQLPRTVTKPNQNVFRVAADRVHYYETKCKLNL